MMKIILIITMFGDEYEIKNSDLLEKIFEIIDKTKDDDNQLMMKTKIEEEILNGKARKIFTNNVIKIIEDEIVSSEKRVSRILTNINQRICNNEILDIKSTWKQNIYSILEKISKKQTSIDSILQNEEEEIKKMVKIAVEDYMNSHITYEMKQDFKNRLTEGIIVNNRKPEEEKKLKVDSENWIEDILE